MKRYCLFVFFLIFSFLNIIYAKDVTLNDMVNVINDGEITKEFIASQEGLYDQETNKKLYKNVTINSEVIDSTLYVYLQLENEDITNVHTITAKMQEDGISLKSVIEFLEEDMEENQILIDLHNLLPLWEMEASDGWQEIKKYISGEYINEINEIVDRCYKSEMHVCRTYTSTYGNLEYISEVEMNEEPANYVIKHLEAEAKETANRKMIAKLVVIAIILIIVVIVLKSMQPKPQVRKY